MQTWTLSADDGTLHDPLDDPTQRIRPTMRGDGTEVVWLPEDGQVAQFIVEGLAVAVGFEPTVDFHPHTLSLMRSPGFPGVSTEHCLATSRLG